MNRLLCIFPAVSLLYGNSETQKNPVKGESPKGMVWIDGSTYTRGTKENPSIPFNQEERPVHKVTVSGFYLDEHEVTNAQFQKFVDATGYQTQAERGWSNKDFPKAPKEALKPGSIIFSGPPKAVELRGQGAEWQWWRFQEGASWKHPTGPKSNLNGIENYRSITGEETIHNREPL